MHYATRKAAEGPTERKLTISEFPEFTFLEELNPHEYQEYVKQFENYSDYNYVSLLSWNKNESCVVSKLNGNLVLIIQDYVSDAKNISILGRHKIDQTVEQLLAYAVDNELPVELVLVPEIVIDNLKQQDLVEIEEDRDNHDYLLPGDEYVELAGKKYANKRKNINKFINKYGARVDVRQCNLSDENIQKAVMELAYKWAFMGTEGSKSGHNELAAIKKLLKSLPIFNEYCEVKCLGVYIDDVLQAFCIYEINGNKATTHFGKSNLEFDKLYEYMMVETLRYIYNTYGISIINNEQDLGIAGLRLAKLSQQPHSFLRKYTIKPRLAK